MKFFIIKLLVILASPFYLLGAWIKALRLSKKRIKFADQYDIDKAYKFIFRVAKFVRILFNIKIEVIDLKKWKYTPGLIVMNHQSNADGIILMLALLTDEKQYSQCGFVAKQELEKDKLFGPFLKCIMTFFIDRKNLRQTVEVFENIKKEMTEKRRSVVVFPEGTRSNKKEMNEFNPGAFKLATQTFFPIKPAAIIDVYKAFKSKWYKLKKVKVVFCDEIPADKTMTINTIGLSKHVHEIINEKIEKYSEENK